MKLRSVIVGCGQIAGGYDTVTEQGRTHASAYKNSSDVTLVGVADSDGKRAEMFARRWGGIKAYSDVKRLLEIEQPDIVSLCTPDETHSDLLQICLDQASIRGVWCEKPLATDPGKATILVDGFERANKILMVNYTRRWNARIGKVRQILRNGEIGAIQQVVAYYGKGIRHNGSHMIDLLVDWFGVPIEQTASRALFDFSPGDPTVDAHLVFEDFSAHLIGTDSRKFSLFECDIIGSTGRIRLVDSGRGIQYYVVDTDPIYSDFKVLHVREESREDIEPPLFVALRELVDAVKSGTSVRSDGHSALAVLKICDELATDAIQKFT